jgi:hypothetical protein
MHKKIKLWYNQQVCTILFMALLLQERCLHMGFLLCESINRALLNHVTDGETQTHHHTRGTDGLHDMEYTHFPPTEKFKTVHSVCTIMAMVIWGTKVAFCLEVR